MGVAQTYEALAQHLEGLGLGLPVAWPNVRGYGDDAPETGYLRMTFVPLDGFRGSLGGLSVRTGIMQVDVMIPDGDGLVSGLQMADQVAAHFMDGDRYSFGGQEVLVDGPPVIGPGIHEKPFYQIPVTIRWRMCNG